MASISEGKPKRKYTRKSLPVKHELTPEAAAAQAAALDAPLSKLEAAECLIGMADLVFTQTGSALAIKAIAGVFGFSAEALEEGMRRWAGNPSLFRTVVAAISVSGIYVTRRIRYACGLWGSSLDLFARPRQARACRLPACPACPHGGLTLTQSPATHCNPHDHSVTQHVKLGVAAPGSAVAAAAAAAAAAANGNGAHVTPAAGAASGTKKRPAAAAAAAAAGGANGNTDGSAATAAAAGGGSEPKAKRIKAYAPIQLFQSFVAKVPQGGVMWVGWFTLFPWECVSTQSV